MRKKFPGGKSKQEILTDLNFFRYMCKQTRHIMKTSSCERKWGGLLAETDNNKLMKNETDWIFASLFSISPCRRVIFHTPLIFSLPMSLPLTSEMRAKDCHLR